MKTQFVLFLTLLLLCLGTGAALAQTPDGETPAEETVCDTETGAAYGLCNAYCEAMDCETDNPSASATACTRVRDKFQQITGRDLPCEAVTCPCTSIPGFNVDLEGLAFCFRYESGIDFSDTRLAEGYSSATNTTCAYRPRSSDHFVLPVTPAQAEVCFQLVSDASASNGVTCF